MKFVFILTVLLSSMTLETASGQSQDRTRDFDFTELIPQTKRNALENNTGLAEGWDFPRQVMIADKQTIAQKSLASKMTASKDLAEKQEARKELTKLLSLEFEQDLQCRQAELEKIKERVSQLAAVLEKRKANQEEIIKLRLQVLANEAEGLDWSAGNSLKLKNKPAVIRFE